MNRKTLLAFAAIAMVVAVLLAVTGGVRVTVGGLRISARSPLAPSIVALVLAAAWTGLAARRGEAARDLSALWIAFEQSAWTIVVLVAIASAGVAIAFGTYSAAGADASGYLSQAAMWASGQLRVPDSLSILPGWPLDAGTTAPLGWRAAAERGWQVPTYGPGLPLLMAAPYAIGGSLAACLVVATCTAIAVLATSAIAFQMAGASAALIAAVTLATAPAFLYQTIQPMSDVPVTAAWMLSWALAIRTATVGHDFSRAKVDGATDVAPYSRAFLAGIACALAVLIRPNLAPLAIVPFLFLIGTQRTANGQPRIANRQWRMANTMSFALPVAAAALLLAWLQWRWYGSPFRSGYGTAEQLFAWSNVAPNASRYLRWLASTSPILLLALVGLWINRGRVASTLAAFALTVTGAYLVYFVFEDWSYLRFLLPALAVAAVLVGVCAAAIVHRAAVPARALALFAMVLLIGGLGVFQARALDTFGLTDAHRRVLEIDRYLGAALPEGAVIVSGEESGAVRFDTGHEIVRWEATSRDDLTRARSTIEAEGRAIWILLDAWEEPLFRDKFRGLPIAALDWPPSVDAGETHRTRAWSLFDRARYLNGERVVTDRLR